MVTAKNTIISPNFLMWKFCGKAQFSHSFGQIAFPKIFHTMKLGEITALYAVVCFGKNEKNIAKKLTRSSFFSDTWFIVWFMLISIFIHYSFLKHFNFKILHFIFMKNSLKLLIQGQIHLIKFVESNKFDNVYREIWNIFVWSNQFD